MMDLTIRADGSHDRGLGHLVRSSVLAAVALDRGHTVTYLTSTPSHTRRQAPMEADIVRLPADDDRRACLAWLDDHGPDVVVTDSYDIDTEYQAAIRRRTNVLAVFIDDPRYELAADMVVNGNLYANAGRYEWRGEQPRWCFGTEYLLLRPAFRELAGREPVIREPAERLLITMGGTDLRNRTPTAIQAIVGTGLDATVVVGPGFTNHDDIEQAAATVEADVTLREDPSDLPELMYQADLAVCTLGTTVYELFAAKTPIVGVPDNDTPMPAVLRKRDLATVVDPSPSVDEINDAVTSLAADATCRRRLQQCYADLVTGNGAAAVLDVLEDEHAARTG